jgi:DNA-binding CsgD family transcriptional regulator
VVFANKAATEILRLRDGLLSDHLELSATTPAATVSLRRAITAALNKRGELASACEPTIIVQRPSGRRPLSIVVAPLPANALRFDRGLPLVAVFVTDPDRAPQLDVRDIALAFRLTVAEARLVQSLAEGRSIIEAAAELSIQPETARKRLKVVFEKTDTHRQAELVRLALLYALRNPRA